MLANFHNATTDYIEDEAFLPGRRKRIARLGRVAANAYIYTLSAAILLLLSIASISTMILSIIGLVWLFSYSSKFTRFKSRILPGVTVFSMVAVLPFIGASLLGDNWLEIGDIASGKFGTMLGLFALMVAKFKIKNLPDYEPDKAAGLRTTATVFHSYRHAAISAVIFTEVAYILASFFIVFNLRIDGPKLIALLVIQAACMLHVLKFLQAYDIAKLNHTMKYDMILSATYLLVAAMPESANSYAIWWSISAAMFIVAVIVPLDSRHGEYQTHRNSEVQR